MNYKGQAAVTDALIFLSIVGVISTLIVASSMNYGLSITNDIKQNYEITYLDSAMKSMYLVNYGRDGNNLFDTNSSDYIMTLLKEEYSSIGKSSENTKKSLFLVLDRIFFLYPQKSYIFSIFLEDSSISTTTSFIMLIRTYGGDEKLYLSCSPQKPLESITKYLQDHSIDQRVTSGKTIFYKDLTKSSPSRNLGDMYLGIWSIVDDKNFEYVNESYDLNCVDFSSQIG